MSREYIWALITLIVAIVLAFLLLFVTRDNVPIAATAEQPSKYDATLVDLDKVALDEAYVTQVKHLFSVWLKDDVAATDRISNGLRIARRAYVNAAGQIAQREEQIKARAAH